MPGRLTFVGMAVTQTATEKRSVLGGAVTSLALLLAIAAIDYLLDYRIHITAVYLVPVFFATWHVGRGAGMGVSVASALLSVGGDLLTGATYRTWLEPTVMVLLWSAMFVVFVLTLTELRRALEMEKMLARVDPLTGIANRRQFLELAGAELHRIKRFGRPLTIAYVDLDNFKEINDRLGHEAGDDLLRAVGNAIHRRMRVTDAVGRLGGDEFALCLPETGTEVAGWVLEQVRAQILAALPPRCRSVTVSIGAVTYFEPAESVEEMLRRADQALYAAKRDGKNQVKQETVGLGPQPGADR
jgi:diguanylate cyclase (GGDEF)-like protein